MSEASGGDIYEQMKPSAAAKTRRGEAAGAGRNLDLVGPSALPSDVSRDGAWSI